MLIYGVLIVYINFNNSQWQLVVEFLKSSVIWMESRLVWTEKYALWWWLHMHENEMNKRGDPLLLISSRQAVLEKYPQITLSWKLNLILKGCCLWLFALQIINKYLEFLEQDTVKKMRLFRRWLRHAHRLFLPQKMKSWHIVITCLFVYLFYVHCFSEEYCIYHCLAIFTAAILKLWVMCFEDVYKIINESFRFNEKKL